MTEQDRVLKLVTRHYLTSKDFNGIPTSAICSSLNISSSRLRRILLDLIKQGEISLISTDFDINPHIKRFSERPEEQQIAVLKPEFRLNDPFNLICVYPSACELKRAVNVKDYEATPFTLELALGAPQLFHKSFDSSVLQPYRDDPRYYFYFDINGHIVMKEEYSNPNLEPSFDEIVLENFGTSLDSEGHRAVAVFLRYLSQLPSQNQQVWKTHVLDESHELHPCYYTWMIIGEWLDCTTVFYAFSAQLKCINRICELLGRQHLFKNDLDGDARPPEFGFLLRPTLKEFNSFVHLLDKTISENIDSAFFEKDVDRQEEIQRRDGRIEVRQKGSIRILDEWLQKYFYPKDNTPIEKMFATFKKIREMRQDPAHLIAENVFDEAYYSQQLDLMHEAYEAISTLRYIFCLNPVASRNNISPNYDRRVMFY